MWNKATLADFIGDRVVYRNLEPMQAGLLGLRQVWAEVGLDHYYVPRKIAPEYAAVLWRYLQGCAAAGDYGVTWRRSSECSLWRHALQLRALLPAISPVSALAGFYWRRQTESAC